MNLISIDERNFPVLITPGAAAESSAEAVSALAKSERDRLIALARSHGALLFRGFALRHAEDFKLVATSLVDELCDYCAGNSPRSEVIAGVYTSTEYPRELSISLHQEMSYTRNLPRFVGFFCEEQPSKGGATPLLDSRVLLESLPRDIVATFSGRRLTYIRNLNNGGSGFGKSWQKTYNVEDRSRVEAHLARAGSSFEWRSDGALRVFETVDAVAVHPVTGQKVWFNQAEQWHPSALDDETRSAMLTLMPQDEFPHYVRFGDGTAIPDDMLTTIRSTQERIARRTPWRRGDMLFLDNMLVAHGRDPFEGPRRILAVLAN